jgi:hypothetical protein
MQHFDHPWPWITTGELPAAGKGTFVKVDGIVVKLGT